MNPVVIAVSTRGHRLRDRLADALGGESREGGKAVAALQTAFGDGRPCVFIGAVGIAVRSLGPHLTDKRTEPPVVVVAEDGSAVVPVLGGHRGANALASQIGTVLNVRAAITTASDTRLGVALDAPPDGWTLADPDAHKDVARALLDGAAVRLDGDLPWLDQARLTVDPEAGLTLRSSVRLVSDAPNTLHYYPRRLVVGVGCERDCSADELIALAERTLQEAGLAAEAVGCVVSLDLKMDEPAVHAVGQRFGVPVRFFNAERLERERPRLANPSETVFNAVGCHGVAEGAALAAADSGGRLVVEKQRSARATCAVAESTYVLDVSTIGVARGHLAIVGLGPGTPAWRTPEADTLIAQADDLVGYGLYLDLVEGAGFTGTVHRFDLGEEEARARFALYLAATGRRVALISSGDPGIYAMATLVFELLDGSSNPAWSKVEVSVAPGISAIQAAAARAGAPIGHDFCTISLSDLLTPWPAIEARVQAAAEGDFVIAFYNPVSKRRRIQLEAARKILLKHRPPETPVLLARSLGRPAESIDHTTLADLDVEAVDMLTVVLIGSSETRLFRQGNGPHWVYTPRGYAGKAGSGLKAGATGENS